MTTLPKKNNKYITQYQCSVSWPEFILRFYVYFVVPFDQLWLFQIYRNAHQLHFKIEEIFLADGESRACPGNLVGMMWCYTLGGFTSALEGTVCTHIHTPHLGAIQSSQPTMFLGSQRKPETLVETSKTPDRQ